MYPGTTYPCSLFPLQASPSTKPRKQTWEAQSSVILVAPTPESLRIFWEGVVCNLFYMLVNSTLVLPSWVQTRSHTFLTLLPHLYSQKPHHLLLAPPTISISIVAQEAEVCHLRWLCVLILPLFFLLNGHCPLLAYCVLGVSGSPGRLDLQVRCTQRRPAQPGSLVLMELRHGLRFTGLRGLQQSVRGQNANSWDS